VKAMGYPVQTHKITTEDGYILTFFRIQAKNQGTFKKDLPVLYLQHGLLDSADTWVIDDEPNCPGLQLANHGYDVWLGNVRGNKYSEEHTVLDPKKAPFWQFTFQNMSEYDLPAAFEYIHRQTDQNITYIGHSQGTIIMFAALSDRNPGVLKYLKKYIALAPVAWVQHISSGPANLMAHTQLAQMLAAFHVNQFLPANWAESALGHEFCKNFVKVCADFLGSIFGFDPEFDNAKQYNVILEHEPAGTSVTNMLHWRQMVLTGKFAKYDYGTAGNIQHYGQPAPPEYDVSKINIPVHLFFSKHDSFVDDRDSQKLLDSLTGCPEVDKRWYGGGHMTYIWSKNISYYFNDLLAVLNRNDYTINYQN
jgi:pimeloyl-ACP methyl ester carboxylesterase